MSPLNLAIERLDEDAVASLIASGVDVNRPEPDLGGCYPLQHAVDAECESSVYRYDMGDAGATPQATITRLLIRGGADPNLADPNGESARSWAEKRLHNEALRLFDSSDRDIPDLSNG